MADRTTIQWTDASWNPLVGCSRVSAGCTRCYAERLVHRGLAPQHRGLTKLVGGEPRWTGEVRLVESALALPLSWKKPRRVFVNSLSDLFHESVPDEWIAVIFGVMMCARRHLFQVLTKRPERMQAWVGQWGSGEDAYMALMRAFGASDLRSRMRWPGNLAAALLHDRIAWPLPNVWLGVSVEDQATADARIPLLLETPSAVRFVSYEPALGPVDFHDFIGLDWLIVGGESGPGARPFDLAWARSIVKQCHAAGIPTFTKQLGARPIEAAVGGGMERLALCDRKGADPSEWPADLRVRKWPA